MKVALVYDRVNKWGGAERVLLALHELFPQAPLYTSVYYPQHAEWAKEFTVIPSFLQSFPLATSAHEFYPLLMPMAFEQFNFDEYDLVISVTSEAAKGILTKPQTKHICYCLTPTRYLWSGYDDYLHNSLVKALASPAISYLRSWDKVAATRPDAFIAISNEVKERIKKYYHRDSQVIYPPLMLNDTKNKKETRRDFFLVVSRLVPYKHIDLAIRACNELQLPLKIIGKGSEEKRLRSLAGSTVEFLGALTDEELIPYYKQCRALLFPGYEDFGLTMAEAQSFGIPVIAFSAGGAKEIIEDKKTGLFFSSQTVTSLKSALQEFAGESFEPAIIRKNAERFSFDTFKKAFTTEVEKIIAL